MKKILLVILLTLTSKAFTMGLGWSSFPFLFEKRLITTELTGILEDGGGAGVQVRYIQKLGPKTSFEGGLGYAGGARAGKIFAQFDYEIFPDYQRQPRISLKAGLENSREYDRRVTRSYLSPLISKGFEFWGYEAYPYMGVPFGITLHHENRTYDAYANLALGATGRLPFEGFSDLYAMFEGQINLVDSYSGIFVGLSFPIN